MNSKWYISTLIILLALIGLNQEQTNVANQQIVLQFTDAEMTSVTAHDDALAKVIEKLQTFGITKVELIEKGDKQLSIRYYSASDAHSVEEFLSETKPLSLTYSDIEQIPSDFPEEEFPETFSIVVSDLQQQTNDGLSSNGKFAFELNQDYNRFSNPVFSVYNRLIALEQDALVQVYYKINRVLTITINNTSNAIPEVRAGPRIIC